MKLNSWLFFALALIAVASTTQAQELRCTQIFMNASEKRICATPALMQLDQQIGELGRRVLPYQDSFKADQRNFRKALKTCKGDEGCLTSSYQVRISELQAFVNTLPPPTNSEAISLAAEAEEAERRRNAQEQARERIADKLEAVDTGAQPVEVAPTVQPQIIQAPSEQLPASDAAQPIGENVEPVADGKSEQAESGGISWLGIGVILLVVLAVIVAFFGWLYKMVRRCPNCTKWWAGEIIDQDRESYTDYETKTFTDTHRDKNFNVTGTTSRRRQVAVRVSNTTNYMRCKLCRHEWTISHSSRSG